MLCVLDCRGTQVFKEHASGDSKIKFYFLIQGRRKEKKEKIKAADVGIQTDFFHLNSPLWFFLGGILLKWGFKKRLLWRPGGGAAGEPGFKGGGAQSAVRQMFTRYRSTCVIHCVLVFQLELLFFCVFSSCFVLFPACQRSCASSLWFHNVSCLLSFVPLCLNNRDIFGFQMTLNGSDSDLFTAPFVTIR